MAGGPKRIVGGNSGCDIAVEASHHAAVTMHSTRHGYYWPDTPSAISQTSTGNWPLMDILSQIMSRFAAWNPTDPARIEWFRDLKAVPAPPDRRPGGIACDESARDALEAEHDTCRRGLRKLVRRFDKAASAARPGRQPSLPVVR